MSLIVPFIPFLIYTLVGDDHDDLDTRLYSWEARMLKDALHAAPKALWAGPWSGREVGWVRSEIAEMFAEGVSSAFALQPRLDAMKLGLSAQERQAVERCEAEFAVTFRRGVEDLGGGPGDLSTRLQRSLFVKTVLVLCLTTRGRLLVALVNGGNRGRPRPVMERSRSLRVVE